MAFYIEEDELCVVDPNGDTILALWERTSPGSFTHPDDHPRDVLDPDAPLCGAALRASARGLPRLFKISRRLMSANFAFAREILENRSPGPVRQQNYNILEVWKYDEHAVENVLRLAHGLYVNVAVDRPMLAEFARIARELGCQRLFDHRIPCWLAEVERSFRLPNSYGDDLIWEMAILSTFPREELIHKAARIAIMHCRGPLNGRGLYIRQALIETIEWERASIINETMHSIKCIFQRLHNTSDPPVPVVDFNNFCCCRDHQAYAYDQVRDIMGRTHVDWLRRGLEHYSLHSIVTALNRIVARPCYEGYRCSTNYAVQSIQERVRSYFEDEEFWTGFKQLYDNFDYQSGEMEGVEEWSDES